MKTREVRNQRMILFIGIAAFVGLFAWRVADLRADLALRLRVATAKQQAHPVPTAQPAGPKQVSVKPPPIEPTPAPRKQGWLRILADPQGSEFEITRLGKSPLSRTGGELVGPIEVGEVTITFRYGDQRFTTNALVREGTTNEVRHTFQYAIAHFRTTPAGASVWLNGQIVGTTPVLVSNLHVGTNHVRLSLRGYLGRDLFVVGIPGTPQSVEDTLVNEELAERSAKAREAATAGDFESALAHLKEVRRLDPDEANYAKVEKSWRVALLLKNTRAAISRNSESDAESLLHDLNQLDPDNPVAKVVGQELASLKARRVQAELDERFSNQLFQAERTYAVGPLDRALDDVDAALRTKPGDPKASALRLKVLAAIEAEQARRRERSMREALIAVRGAFPNYSLYDNAEWKFKGTPEAVWEAIQAAIRQPKHTWAILNQKKATNGVYYAQIQMSGSFKPTKSGLIFIGKGPENDVLVLGSFLEYVTGDDYKPLPMHPDFWHRDTPQDARDRRKETRDAFETAVRKELAISTGK